MICCTGFPFFMLIYNLLVSAFEHFTNSFILYIKIFSILRLYTDKKSTFIFFNFSLSIALISPDTIQYIYKSIPVDEHQSQNK